MTSEPPAAPAAASESNAPAQIYRMSAEGRRTAWILLMGVVTIWIFALWTLITQLQGGLSGPEWVTALLMVGILLVAPVVGWTLWEEQAAVITLDEQGLTYRSLPGLDLRYAWSQVAGVAEPAAGPGRWARLFMDDPAPAAAPSTEESSPSTGRKAEPESNHISRMEANADAVAGAGTAADLDGEGTDDARQAIPIRVMPPPAGRIANPVLRALWRQAHGDSLPLPSGLTDRPTVVAAIRARTAGAPAPTGSTGPPPA